ncbi:MAG: ATP-binding cassette domain-containing protein, partial [FCB group bacterium]|nr:ATP-binding cassette domain-containing protein [FCB group bacterium]
MFRLTVKNLSKKYGYRKVFSKINFELTSGQSLGVVGPNGSGKSTMLKVLLSLERPTKGDIQFFHDDENINGAQIRDRVSFVAPYLNLYDHLTAEENLN